MDEPFSALDVLTAETLRNEIGKLCADPGSELKSLVIVTHNISEAVYLAKRIVVLAAHPGRVQVILPNPLPYPRDPDAPEFQQLVAHIHGVLTQEILPDAPVATTERVKTVAPSGAPRRLVLAPLPHATIVEVIGLLRFLGEEDEGLYELAKRIGKEFGATLTVVKAAEILNLVETPGQEVRLLPLGRQLLQVSVAEQKKLLHDEMMKLKIFELLLRMLGAHETHEVSEEALLQELAILFPTEKPKLLLRTMVGWGRYVELINYDQRRHLVREFQKQYFGKPPAERLG
jgi:NitT/TauT family transport system ATP-binding protein